MTRPVRITFGKNFQKKRGKKVMNLTAYDIDIYRLANRAYQYQYQIDREFFKNFENSLVEQGGLQAKVLLDKQESLIALNFHIAGTVELECDRSLEKFDYPVNINEKLLFQYGQEEQELTEEIVIITRDTQSINVAQYIYEFIGLAIPMKKLHPKYEKDDNPFTDGEIVYTSERGGTEENNHSEDNGDDNIDPRWDILRNLKK